MLVAMIRAYLLSATAGLFAAIVVLLAPPQRHRPGHHRGVGEHGREPGGRPGHGRRWREQDGPQDAYSFHTDGGGVVSARGFRARSALLGTMCGGCASRGQCRMSVLTLQRAAWHW